MTALIAWLITNPTVIAIVGALLGALGYGIHQRRAGAKAQQAKQMAKEAKVNEQHLRDLAAAADAGNRVDPSRVSNDPYNRDHKPKG